MSDNNPPNNPAPQKKESGNPNGAPNNPTPPSQ